ncbi:MAG: hypothetical protein QXU75_07935 [Candidatus Methanomethylicaceae archaeon]
MAVYLALQNSVCEANGKQDKTVAIQKCGNPPYEISLRFAGCILRCGACFASGYSWSDRYLQSTRVQRNIPLDRLIKDYEAIPRVGKTYNWMRILGGEPLQNEEYINYLFAFLKIIAERDTSIFRNGIVIQTNGIFIGTRGSELVRRHLEELYSINPQLRISIEISIKGTNPEEFALLTQSSTDLFKANIQAYYELLKIGAPNLRPTVIAGFGISESLLLTNGRSGKSLMTILFDDDTPTFHPSIWSNDFKILYDDFTSQWRNKNQLFHKMPMYGIKDEFNYMWVKYSLKQAKKVFGRRFYDSQFSKRSPIVEQRVRELLDYFFLSSNQDYYSELIK